MCFHAISTYFHFQHLLGFLTIYNVSFPIFVLSSRVVLDSPVCNSKVKVEGPLKCEWHSPLNAKFITECQFITECHECRLHLEYYEYYKLTFNNGKYICDKLYALTTLAVKSITANSNNREPRRIPAKKICCLLSRSRKIRRAVQKDVKQKIPASSCIHRCTQAFSHECGRMRRYDC